MAGLMMEASGLMTARRKENIYSHSMVMLREHITPRVVKSYSCHDLLCRARSQEMRYVVDWSLGSAVSLEES